MMQNRLPTHENLGLSPEEFEEKSNSLRIYSIIRGDLKMTPGKMASQAAHASKNCLLKAALNDPILASTYQGNDFIGTQIILEAKNEDAIRKAYEAANDENLITNLVIDSGHVMLPHFTGDPIVTALGIGPCTREQAHKITKKFGVVK